MRTAPRTSTFLSVPLGLSSALLVILLFVTTTPTSPVRSPLRGAHADTTRVVNPNDHTTDLARRPVSTQHVPEVNLSSVTRPSRVSATTTTTLPNVVTPLVTGDGLSGTVSGGPLSMSLVTVSPHRTGQFVSSQPLTLSLWDGLCTVDAATQTVTNDSASECTVQLQAPSFTTWHLSALA